MLAFGIFRPILNNFSTVKQAIIASKDTWFYAFFIYLIVYYENIDLGLLFKLIKNISIYFTVIYFVYLLFPAIVPPVYDGGYYVRTYFPTFISLSIFLYLIEIKLREERSVKLYVLVVFQLLGLALAEHSSLTIMTLVFGLVYLFSFDKDLEFKKEQIIRMVGFFVFGVFLALVFVNGLYEGIIDKFNAVLYSEDLALRTRDLYNEFRWDAINKQLFWGYGFLHQSSSLMEQYKLSGDNAFMERFAVIDSGYVDLLIKFGYAGTAIILGILTKYFSMGFFKKHKNYITLAMSFYLAQYAFMNYTWSVYTFAHGIIPGALAFYIIIMYQDYSFDNLQEE